MPPDFAAWYAALGLSPGASDEEIVRAKRAYNELYHADRLAHKLLKKCSITMAVKTAPEGAKVYKKNYGAPEAEWELLGISPLVDVRVPTEFCRWKLEKEGFETVMAVQPTALLDMSDQAFFIPGSLERALDKKGDLPEGMVRVPAVETREGKVPGFLIDRHEVTNKQYKEFMDKGGYKDRKFGRRSSSRTAASYPGRKRWHCSWTGPASPGRPAGRAGTTRRARRNTPSPASAGTKRCRAGVCRRSAQADHERASQ